MVLGEDIRLSAPRRGGTLVALLTVSTFGWCLMKRTAPFVEFWPQADLPLTTTRSPLRRRRIALRLRPLFGLCLLMNERLEIKR
jgi:hypothetical protein